MCLTDSSCAGTPQAMPIDSGAIAQLGERLVCNQEATGSIPVSSTDRNCSLQQEFIK